MAEGDGRRSYDELPYPVRSYSQSSPDRLLAMARLHGLTTPPVTSCRVLELGCAAGGNIIPLAQVLPGSTFVGVDATAAHIAQGQEMVARLGLRNIQLEHMSLVDVDDGWGYFDYIIAHGIYSWVPPDVREHLLRICKQNLAPNGVAYISYNTYPGWSLLGMLRDALLYHTEGIADQRQRAAAARSMLDFLADAEGDYTVFPERPMRIAARFFKEKVDDLGDDGDSYLVHELLEEINEPLLFTQFVAHAARHGLQYLCEAQLSDTLMSGFPPAVAQAIAGVASDPVDAGQYMDFVRDQTFRQTLLCHDDVSLERTLDLDAVFGLCAMSRAVVENVEGAPAASFGDEVHNITFTTEHAVTREAMLHLCQWCPRAINVDELVATAAARSGDARADAAAGDDRRIVAANLLRAYSYSKELVSLHAFAPPVAARIGDKPVASPVARLQAQGRSYVTNQYHEQVPLDPVSRFLLPLLDGTHNRDDLLRALSDGAAGGAGVVDAAGTGATSSPEEQLAEALRFLMRFALLVG